MNNRESLKIFYDGACPFCVREMRFLKSKDKDGRLIFEDTSQPGFDPKLYGLPDGSDRLIHARSSDGRTLIGLEVFRQAYRHIGLGWLLAPTAWPILKPLSDLAYKIFAKNRVRLGRLFGRKCDTNCKI